MTTGIPTLGGSLRALGRHGQSVDAWALTRWKAHRRRTLDGLGIVDGVNFGRIRGAGVLSGLSQFRIEWWDDVVAEARRVDASSVVVRVDQIQWLLARVDRSDDTPAEQPAGR
jgi:hypothetical protein